MKIKAFDLKKSIENLKSNYRLAIAVFLICVLVGVLCGMYQKNVYHEKKAPEYTGEETITLDDIEKDGSYYFEAYDRIKRKEDCLELYFDYFQKVGLSEESKEKLDGVKERFNKFYEEFEEEEYTFWNTPMSVTTAEETIDYYDYRIEDLNENKLILEDEYKDGSDSGSLSNQKKQIMEANLAHIEIYDEKLKALRNLIAKASPAEIEKSNAKGDESLEKISLELNDIIAEYNSVMKDISQKDNYAILFNKDMFTDQGDYFGLLKLSDKDSLLVEKKNEALIYARSHEGLDNGKERMYAMITFFTLFGIIVAVVLGAFYTPRRKKEEK